MWSLRIHILWPESPVLSHVTGRKNTNTPKGNDPRNKLLISAAQNCPLQKKAWSIDVNKSQLGAYLPNPCGWGQSFCRVEQVWIQTFPSPTVVVKPSLKCLFYPTVYSMLEGEWLHSYLSQKYSCYVKCKQFCSGFEPWEPCAFHVTITITLRTPPK